MELPRLIVINLYLLAVFPGVVGAQWDTLADLPESPTVEEARPAGEMKPITNERVVSLVKAGTSDNTIISLIAQFPSEFDASPEAVAKLHVAGVSKLVINEIKLRAPSLPAAKPEQSKTLTNDSVISLSQAGLSDADIVFVINKSRVNFDLSANEISRFKKSGVGNVVIAAAMLRSEVIDRQENTAASKSGLYSLGLGYPYLSLKYDFKALALEGRFVTGFGVRAYAGRGYWIFHHSDKLKGFSGLEGGYITFNTLDTRGTGYEGALFIGGEYFMAKKFSVLMDFAPTLISLKSGNTNASSVEYVVNMGLYYHF